MSRFAYGKASDLKVLQCTDIETKLDSTSSTFLPTSSGCNYDFRPSIINNSNPGLASTILSHPLVSSSADPQISPTSSIENSDFEDDINVNNLSLRNGTGAFQKYILNYFRTYFC